MRLFDRVAASLCSMFLAMFLIAGKIVTIKGTVVRISPVKPMVQSASFACSKCGSEQQMSFKEGIFALPTSCGEDGCRARTFTLLKKTAKSIDWQKIRIQVGDATPQASCPLSTPPLWLGKRNHVSLHSGSKPASAWQELSHADKEDIGRVPRTLEVELTRDLVDSCSAGDGVTVLGAVKVLSTTAEAGESVRGAGPATFSCPAHAAVVQLQLGVKSRVPLLVIGFLSALGQALNLDLFQVARQARDLQANSRSSCSTLMLSPLSTSRLQAGKLQSKSSFSSQMTIFLPHRLPPSP